MFSPLDDRYRHRLSEIEPFVGERNFLIYMAHWACAWVYARSDTLIDLEGHYEALVQEAVAQEKITNHQVIGLLNALKKLFGEKYPWHLGLTSEDLIHNARCTQMSFITMRINESLSQVNSLIQKLDNLEILEFTHGQPATPVRLIPFLSAKLDHRELPLPSFRLGGCNGQLTALRAYSEDDLYSLAKSYIEAIQIYFPNLIVDLKYPPKDNLLQIYPANSDFYTAYMVKSLFLKTFSKTLWDHASRKILKLKVSKEYCGSSAMPHKVNPIHFENAEGCFNNAYAIIQNSLVTNIDTRGLRDLSGSVCNRFGIEGLVWVYLGLDSLISGLKNSSYSLSNIQEEFKRYPECLTELYRYHRYSKEGKDYYYELKETPVTDYLAAKLEMDLYKNFRSEANKL